MPSFIARIASNIHQINLPSPIFIISECPPPTVSTFKVPPLYDALLERNVEQEREGKKQKQISFKVIVEHNSFSDGKLIKDLLWPPECAVKTITKNGEQILASAETKLEGGDLLLIKAKT